MILTSLIEQPWFIFIVILIIFGVLVLAVFLFKKYFYNAKVNDNLEKPSEEEIVENELNNYLVDIEPDQQSYFDKEIKDSNKSKDDTK